MKILGALFFTLSVFASYSGQTPPQQAGQVQAIFDSFHSSLAHLTKSFDGNSTRGIKADIVESLNSITENVQFLEAVMTLGKPIPAEYLAGVSLDAALLRKLAAQRAKTDRQLKTLYDGLKEVDADLMVKVTGPRAGGDVIRVVEVFVHAKKGAEDVGAYQVWYVMKGWAKDPSHFKPFDKLTDPLRPSVMRLPPGIYLLWLKGQSVTQGHPARIGENGETRRVIHLPVP